MLPDPSLSCGKATSFFVGRVSTMVFDRTSSAQSQSQLKIPQEAVFASEEAEALPAEIECCHYARRYRLGPKATSFRSGEHAHHIGRRPTRSPHHPPYSFYTGLRLHRVRL